MTAITMKKTNDEDVDQIDIFGTIGEDWFGDSTTQREFLAAIRASKSKSIRININSGGGSIFEGMAMFDALKETKAKTTARVIGFAGSMATIVMLGADTVEIVDGSLVMIHNPSTYAGGESKDLRKQADVLDKLRDGMARIYADKTGMEIAEVTAMMDDETWLDAEEARSLGLVDKIVGDGEEAKASIKMLDLAATCPAAKIPLRFAAKVGGVSQMATSGTMQTNQLEGEPKLSTLEEIASMLGLGEDATEQDILDAVQKLVEETGDQEEVEMPEEPAGMAGDEDELEEEVLGDEVDDLEEDEDPMASSPVVPEGMVLVDADTLNDLKERANASADASKAADASQIVVTAISEGRIPAAKADRYIAALEADFETFSKLLTASEEEGGLAKGLIPVSEIGTSHDSASVEAGGTPVEYDASLFPQLNKTNANRIIETE